MSLTVNSDGISVNRNTLCSVGYVGFPTNFWKSSTLALDTEKDKHLVTIGMKIGIYRHWKEMSDL